MYQSLDLTSHMDWERDFKKQKNIFANRSTYLQVVIPILKNVCLFTSKIQYKISNSFGFSVLSIFWHRN